MVSAVGRSPRLPSRASVPTTISAIALGCAVLAFVARLGRGGGVGGLWAYRGYDDGLYFAASVAFVHGLVPYRDFLLLHPPGIVLVLAPFAALTHWFPDATALAVARVAYLLLGAVNTVLVVRVAAGWGRRAALVAGLLYALLPVTMGVEYLTMLEPWGTVAVLGAVVLARRAGRVGASPWWSVAVGAVAAVGPLTKIWGVLPLGVLVLWHGHRLGARAAGLALAGAATTAAAVLGPFAIVAGPGLWRDVVIDQLGRPRTADTVSERIAVLAGAPLPGSVHAHPDAVAAGLLIVLSTCAAVAWRARRGRLWVTLGTVQVAMLLVAPPVNYYYGAFVAPAMVLVVAAAVAHTPLWSRVAGAVAVGTGVSAVVIGMLSPLSTPFPTKEIRAHLPDHGCVRTDSPGALVLLDLFTTQVEAGCPVQLDVSGMTFDRPYTTADGPAAMEHNPRYQHAVADYLGSGAATVLVRRTGDGFSARTAQRLRAGRHVLWLGHGVRILTPPTTLVPAPPGGLPSRP